MQSDEDNADTHCVVAKREASMESDSVKIGFADSFTLTTSRDTHSDTEVLLDDCLHSVDESAPRSLSMSPLRYVPQTTKVNVSHNKGHKQINQYDMIKTIGRGSFSKVKLAKCTRTGVTFAIKIMDKSLLRKKRTFSSTGFSTEYDAVKREIAVMKKLDHNHIVRLWEVMDDPQNDKIYLVLEYVSNGAVMNGCDKSPSFPIDKCRTYIRDTISGLEYVHFQGVAHRDIKPENLLVTQDNRIKIADFGASILFDGGNDKVCKTAGSIAFMAPEMCTADSNSFSATLTDIWACGVTLFFFVFGQCPFFSHTSSICFEKILNDPIIFPHEIPVELADLLRRMLEKDPYRRISIEDIKTHAWITEDGQNPMPKSPSSRIDVSSDDVDNAFTLVQRVVMMIRLKGKMRRFRKRVNEKKFCEVSHSE